MNNRRKFDFFLLAVVVVIVSCPVVFIGNGVS